MTTTVQTGPEELLAYDREHLWHPYTSMTAPTPVRLVDDARGAQLRVDGAWVVDGMSSWWAAIHGYRHPVLDQAVTDQAGRFSHVMFGGLTHEPAIELGRRLVDITPDGLERVFLADSGSVSVEVAMKMVLQYQRGTGHPDRIRMLTVRGGYHGDTFDCMSVTDPVGGMHAMWAGLLPQQVFAPQPPAAGADAATVAAWATTLRHIADQHHHELAGIIVEPLLQGAGGMHPYPPECLAVLREIADEHGLLLVFDEIATGFGRTGHLFVSEIVTPDILCLGKALTGGYVSLAAVVTTDAVARGISGSDSGVVMHGPTFMGNPLACAIASASIDLLLGTDWKARVSHIGDRLATGLAPLREVPGVADSRTIGAVGVVQLDHPVDVVAATDAAVAAGVWLRPFRDLIYTMPPFVISDDELDRLIVGITEAVKAG
ncbi:adenosylmethionine--8-amino-7-oxononanoate transaminase [Nocardioides humilatus]|uniref:Adenosylmethionine-8-amino-7-oxononanoate aminotransferase n=1 Tax=Nocardioides humilatus TaxID=2607660 RepID=A0A5B1LDQ2_9ACTN|nr:adenosylmethionine--8-amino-7-oxononanoate transaminase [Nocardioides humilatus]KAA1418576.1 adenosylmethionine--8-amino-7-oxononanoate transaminase [Nocardioides humilatus]